MRELSSFALRCAFAILATGALFTSLAFGQATEPLTPAPRSSTTGDPDRQHALELYRQGKMVEAMPLFEQLCAKYPNDNGLWEGWGASTLGYSQTLTDPALRKKTRVLARARLIKAKELGDSSNLLQTLLSMLQSIKCGLQKT